MLRISSTTNLSPSVRDSVSDFIRREIAFQKKIGFDAIDFSMALFKNTAGDLRRLAETARSDAESLGMRFEVCHLPFAIKTSDDLESYKDFNGFVIRAIDAAAVLGVDFAVMHPTTATVPAAEFNKVRDYDFVMKHLTPFAEYALKRGVTLAIENMGPIPRECAVHRFCQTPEEVCEVADALSARVCWDFGHANMAGLKQSEALHCVGSRLAVLHVNDNLGGDDIHLPPFLGNIDWRDAMRGLTDIGFKGLFNFEIATDKVPFGMRESFAQYLVASAREIMNYMEK